MPMTPSFKAGRRGPSTAANPLPVLSITRCVTEAAALDLAPEVLDNYLWGNAQDFFFGGKA